MKTQHPIIIAEVAQAHDGSLGMAHAYIDAIAKAGADAVKFQTHIAEAESTPAEPWRVKFSTQDLTRYDYWHRMEFSESQWLELKKHADKKNLLFYSSAFSLEAVELLKRVGVAGWRIASGEVSNRIMLESILETRLPVLLSTGMSTLNEIDAAVEMIKSRGIELTIMQCTSLYPTPPEKTGLNMIPFFQERYQCSVGLSDHSGKIYPGLAAAALGASVIEVHAVFDREMFGPDVPVSLTFKELIQLSEGSRFIQSMLSNPVDKDILADELNHMRQLFTKSIVASDNIEAGIVIERHHVALKKPGTGLSPAFLPKIIGRRLSKSLIKDEFLTEDVLES